MMMSTKKLMMGLIFLLLCSTSLAKPFYVKNNKAYSLYSIQVSQDYISSLIDVHVKFISPKCIKVRVKAKPELMEMLRDADESIISISSLRSIKGKINNNFFSNIFYKKWKKRLDKWMKKKGKKLSDILKDLGEVHRVPVWSYSSKVHFSKQMIDLEDDEFTVCFDKFEEGKYVKFGLGTTTITITRSNVSLQVDPYMETCLAHCEHEILIKNNNPYPINISPANFIYDLSTLQRNVKTLYYTTETYQVKIPIYNVTQVVYEGIVDPTKIDCIQLNETHYVCNEYTIVNYTTEERSRKVWKDLDGIVTVPENSDILVKIVYDIPPNTKGEWNLTFYFNGSYIFMDPWWNSSWQYRKPIDITSNVQSNLLTVDTQSLILEGKMNPDCSDIRFTWLNTTDLTEVEIPYYLVEDTCNTTSTQIWIKLPVIPSSQETIYMYYGNPTATSVSDYSQIFVAPTVDWKTQYDYSTANENIYATCEFGDFIYAVGRTIDEGDGDTLGSSALILKVNKTSGAVVSTLRWEPIDALADDDYDALFNCKIINNNLYVVGESYAYGTAGGYMAKIDLSTFSVSAEYNLDYNTTAADWIYAIDYDGNYIYVSGFSPTGNSGDEDILVRKLFTNGTEIVSFTYDAYLSGDCRSGTLYSKDRSFGIISDGNYEYIVGRIECYGDWDADGTNEVDSRMYVLKLDNSLNLVSKWIKDVYPSVTANQYEYTTGVAASNNYIWVLAQGSPDGGYHRGFLFKFNKTLSELANTTIDEGNTVAFRKLKYFADYIVIDGFSYDGTYYHQRYWLFANTNFIENETLDTGAYNSYFDLAEFVLNLTESKIYMAGYDYGTTSAQATIYSLSTNMNFTPAYVVEETEETQVQPPQFNSFTLHRAFKTQGTLSYCGSNTVYYSTGANAISVTLTIKNASKPHYLIVRHIKNSNSLSYYVNGNLVGTSSSTIGTLCNNNNWVWEKFYVDPSNFTGNQVTINIVPSGTDDNYIDYIALAEADNRTLFGGGWNIVVELNVTDLTGAGLDQVNNSITKLYNNSELFYDFFTTPTISGIYSKTYYANDTTGLTSTLSINYEVDATPPNISTIVSPNTLLIDFNESYDYLTFYYNITDPHLYEVKVYLNDTPETYLVSGNSYNSTISFDEAGIYEFKVCANDTLENTICKSKYVNVSKVIMLFEPFIVVELNNYSIPYLNNATLDPENQGFNFTAYFGIRFIVKANATFNFNETFYKLIEVYPLTNATLNTSNYWISGRYIYFTDSFNKSDNEITRVYEGYVEGENVTTYWQNDPTKSSKRYFRIDSNLDYNYTLEVKIKFYLPEPYDPYNYHAVLYECTVPSSIDRYTCDGSWINTGEVGNYKDYSITHVTTLSSRLFYVDILPGAQIITKTLSSTGGGGAALTTTTQELQEKEKEVSLPTDLKGILSWPIIPSIPFITPLTIGIAIAMYLLYLRTKKKSKKVKIW